MDLFVFSVNVCSLPEVISICCSEFYFLVLNFILPGQLWATVDMTEVSCFRLIFNKSKVVSLLTDVVRL